MMKAGASAGLTPAKVSLAARASVTAGFAKEVLSVNQYAATMKAATANGTAFARLLATLQTVASRPNDATNSLRNCAGPVLTCCDAVKTDHSNKPWATATPK